MTIENRLQKTRNVLHMVLSAIVLLILLGAIVSILANTAVSDLRPDFSMPLVLLSFAVICIVFAAVTFGLYRLNTRHPRRLLPVMLAVAAVALVWQVFFVHAVYTPIGWDVGPVVLQAGGEDWSAYFYAYPNNFGAAFLLKLWHQFMLLFGSADVWGNAVALSVLMMDLSLALLTVWAWRERGGLFASLVLLPGIFVIALSPYNTVPYTDTMGLFFLVASFVLFRGFVRAQKPWVKGLCLLLFCFFAVAGLHLKASVFIVAIAVVIVGLFYLPAWLKRRQWRKLAAAILACVIGFGASQLLYNEVAKPYVVPYYNVY